MSRRFTTLFALLLLCLPLTAHAETLAIVTGPKTGTYYAFGKDIAQLAGKSGINVDVKTSEGSIDNIKRINSSENAAIGIVQSDVLGFLSRSKSKESMRMAANLRMIFPFYNEEVHVLARNDIKSFADLQGKKVAIGEDGSGNMLTSINLFSMMNITPAQSLKIPPAQGVVEVLKGDADAVIFVGGKPVRLFKNLEDLTLPENEKYAAMLSQVHFLPLDSPKMLEEYKPAELTRADYSFIDKTVPTIAVQAVLISYDFAQNGGRQHCELLAKLTKNIRSSLLNLQQKGHPKWREVDLNADSGIWKKDSCAWSNMALGDADHSKLMTILERNRR